MIKHCVVCGGCFKGNAPAKYCSPACKIKIRRAELRTVNCASCGLQFITAYPTQTCCSQKCGRTVAIRKMKLRELVSPCPDCGVEVKRRGTGRPGCCELCKRKRALAAQKRYHARKGRVTGVGSGGNQKGKKNPNWKHGKNCGNLPKKYMSDYRERGIRIWGKLCAICGRPDTVVHHIDGNKLNSIDRNLIVLCEHCHWTVHRSLSKVTPTHYLVEALYYVWPEGRSKITEKTGNPMPEVGESEVKAEGNAQPAAETRQTRPKWWR